MNSEAKLLGAEILNFIEEVAIFLSPFGVVQNHYVNAERQPFSATHSPDILLIKSNESGDSKYCFVEIKITQNIKQHLITKSYIKDRLEFATEYLGIALCTYIYLSNNDINFSEDSNQFCENFHAITIKEIKPELYASNAIEIIKLV